MIATVYHTNQDNFYNLSASFPDDFVKVADVETSSLGDVFRITNHIDSDWTRNPEVVKLYAEQVRSTSVGDVVVLEGKAHRCLMCGWGEIKADEENDRRNR